ncbi:hypothetical protein CL617_04100 [archaeon]|nr:hypothetical protein [archaeon]|tara:strand:- start:21803 stop:22624 length:822 start_codon:yes stop_codon:yes gene_type:complete
MKNQVTIPGSIVYKKYPKKNSFERQFNLRFSANTTRSKIKKVKTNINFFKHNFNWLSEISLDKNGGSNLYLYGNRPQINILVRSNILPKKVKKIYYDSSSNVCKSFPMNIKLNLDEFNKIGLKPWDFLHQQDLDAQSLLKEALDNNFNVSFIPKGWSYDLQLIGPKNSVFFISIFYYKTKDERRNRAKRAQKLLGDISKLLPEVYKKKFVPVIVSQEFESKKNRTIMNYVNFYRDKFKFEFIITNFKKHWEKEVCRELLRIDKGKKQCTTLKK